MPQLRKPFVIAGFSLLWLIVSIVRAPERFVPTADMGIDASCMIALGAGLREAFISGRDFQFTYGPLTQVLAFAGAWFHNPWSPLDALPLIVLAFETASICLLAVSLILLKELDWKDCTFIYIFAAGLNLFSEPTSFRVLAFLLSTVLTCRALNSRSDSAMVRRSVLVGVMCLVAQLTTAEMGLYSIAASLSTFAIWTLLCIWHRARGVAQPQTRSVLISLAVVATTYIGANVIVSSLLAFSAPSYHYFFDYQRYALEAIGGYNFTAGLPWELTASQTLGIAIVAAFTLVAGLGFALKSDSSHAALLLPLLVSSMISLKSAFVRSDTGHITQATSLLLFAFVLIGALYFRNVRSFKTPVILWSGMFGLLWLSWPWAGFYAASDIFVAAGNSPFQKLMRIRASSSSVEKVLPDELVAAVADTSNTPMLTFPYQNHIAIKLQRKVLAPVLQSFDATTPKLQNFYVEQLEEHGQNLDVVYGMDDIAFPTLDSVQTITRLPIIFDYLYEHFGLTTDAQFGHGFYLLRRITSSRRFNTAEVFFDIHKTSGSEMEIRPQNPSRCSLLKFDLRVNYPAVQYFGRPLPIDLTVFQNEALLLKTGLVAIAPTVPFSTYISLMPPELFHKVFAKGSAPTSSWNLLRIGPRRSDWLGVPYSELHIDKITCVTIPPFEDNLAGN